MSDKKKKEKPAVGREIDPRAYVRMTEGRSLGVSCLILCNGCVLMGWHNARAGWEFPGGGQKCSETILAAVVREVKEETGLELDHDKLRFLGWDESEPEWFNLCFAVELDSMTHIEVQPEAKHREWQWFPLCFLPNPLNHLAAGLRDQPWFARWWADVIHCSRDSRG